MPIQAEDIEKLILSGFPDAKVVIRDLAGDGDHYEASVSSQAFKGKSRIEQHKMVYTALGDLMTSKLHALSLKTFIPTE